MKNSIIEYNYRKSDISPGNIIPVYRNFTEFKDYEGKAVVISVDKLGRSFIIDDLPESHPECITYKTLDCDIIFIDSPNKGFRTKRHIPYIWRHTQLVTSGEQGYEEYTRPQS